MYPAPKTKKRKTEPEPAEEVDDDNEEDADDAEVEAKDLEDDEEDAGEEDVDEDVSLQTQEPLNVFIIHEERNANIPSFPGRRHRQIWWPSSCRQSGQGQGCAEGGEP